jgi:hypothetical protein
MCARKVRLSTPPAMIDFADSHMYAKSRKYADVSVSVRRSSEYFRPSRRAKPDNISAAGPAAAADRWMRDGERERPTRGGGGGG